MGLTRIVKKVLFFEINNDTDYHFLFSEDIVEF